MLEKDNWRTLIRSIRMQNSEQLEQVAIISLDFVLLKLEAILSNNVLKFFGEIMVNKVVFVDVVRVALICFVVRQ